MATLLVSDRTCLDIPPAESQTMSPLALHDWLQGHWALLFTNPEDFAPPASTPPGFIACVGDALHRARTKAATVVHGSQSPSGSWLQQVNCDRSLIVLDAAPSSGSVVDFATRALTLQLARLEAPYVLILDERGRCRSTLCYRPRRIDRARTVEELLQVICALRGDAASHVPPGQQPAQLAARVTP